MTAKDILEAKERISQSMKEMRHEIVYMPGRKHVVYAGCVNSDLTEGRGVTLERDYFWTKEEALASVKGQDTQGSDGTTRQRMVIVGGDQKFYPCLSGCRPRARQVDE